MDIVENNVVYLPRNSQGTVSLQTESMALSAISQMSDEPALSPKSEGVALLKSEYGTFCFWRRLCFVTSIRVKDPKTRGKIVLISRLEDAQYLMRDFFIFFL